MANGVHTAVKPVQPAGPNPVRDAVVALNPSSIS